MFIKRNLSKTNITKVGTHGSVGKMKCMKEGKEKTFRFLRLFNCLEGVKPRKCHVETDNRVGISGLDYQK